MNYLFYMGHPAHFHLLKQTISELKNNEVQIIIVIQSKDVLEDLVRSTGLPYHNILPEGRSNTKLGILFGVVKRFFRLYHLCRTLKPDLLIGTSVENSFITKFVGIPSVNLNEDDAHTVPLYAKMSYPWASVILSPQSCNNGKWEKKSLKYPSIHELAYLHPDHFNSNSSIVQKYINKNRPYCLIRFSGLSAHHDQNVSGINDQIALKLIKLIQPFSDVYITSEREIAGEMEQFRLVVHPSDMHHVLSQAILFIGDSQTMCAEAGVLGIPFIRYNSFVGRLGYLDMLENHYKLGIGILQGNTEELFTAVHDLLSLPNRHSQYQQRRSHLLKNLVNLSKFLTTYLLEYPINMIQDKDLGK